LIINVFAVKSKKSKKSKKKLIKKEIVSNGKLKALQKSILKFEISEKLVGLSVKNGYWVKKGSIIASINNQKAQQKLNTAKLQFEKAKLSREELLIGQGYSSGKINDIPKNILNIANIRSNYSSAQNDFNIAQYNYNTLTLKAPFSGKIAN